MITATKITANEVAVSSDGVFTLQTKKKESVSSSGECFSTKVDDGECFSVRAGEDECFFIKKDEIEEPLLDDKPDLSKLGFGSIVCVQANGFNEIVVIGSYTSDGMTYNDVIAKVLYVESVSGGIGTVNGVLDVLELSYFNTIENGEVKEMTKEDVDRLDGWDVASNTRSLVIVLKDKTAIWISPVTLTETNRQTDANDCYFDEDTYSVSGYEDLGTILAPKWYGTKHWQTHHNDGSLCRFDISCEEIEGDPYNGWCASEGWYGNYDVPNSKVKTRSQSSGEEQISSIHANGFCYNIRNATASDYTQYDNVCKFEGTKGNKRSEIPVIKRKDLLIVKHPTSHSTYILKDNDGEATMIGDRIIQHGQSWDWTVPNFATKTGLFCAIADNDDFIGISMDISQLGKIARYGKYIQIGVSGITTFILDDGTTKQVSNRNVTMSKGVCIEADGSSKLKQTVIEEII